VAKTASWKTFAGLGLAAAVLLRLSAELPIHGFIDPTARACGMTYVEIQTKLEQIEIDYKNGLYTASEYIRRRKTLLDCRDQLMTA